MAILTKAGRVALTIAVSNQTLHLAWGRGDPAWDPMSPPKEDINAAVLRDEIGRRLPDRVQFVTPDPVNGLIETRTGRYTVSGVPTNHIHIQATFAKEDAPTDQIREIAVFLGSIPIEGLPPGQRYFLPAQIASPGTLLAIEHIATINRSPGTRTIFDFVQEL